MPYVGPHDGSNLCESPLLWGVRIFPLLAALMIPATLCTGLVLAIYRDSLRDTLE